MHLVNWQPTLRQTSLTTWLCSVEVTLTCPVCKSTKKFKTPEKNLGMTTGYVAKFAIDHLNTFQGDGIGPCEFCGVLSVLPKADEAKFRTELRTSLEEWLKEHAGTPTAAAA